MIGAVNPTWLERAARRTEELRTAGQYKESSSIWSEIKSVYLKFQGASKCAFCERKLEAVPYGLAEQAVEHFRPKGGIKPWRVPAALAKAGVAVADTPKGPGGYYLLAYDLFNYSASCHPCNSALKQNYFPVAGSHDVQGARPEAMLKEQPLLIYPIGDFDDPPEDLIHFHGISPQAVETAGHKRNRALVTIEFFRLDSTTRKNLIRERAMVIVCLFMALEALTGAPSGKDKAQKIVSGLTSPGSSHTNCAVSFKRLYEKDRREAERIYERAVELVESAS